MNGLSTQEVQNRIQEGKVNNYTASSTKSYTQIILGNVMTFFNLLNAAFFAAIILVGSFKNGLFMIVILINTAIGIFQEIRTKITLDRLTILNMSDVSVIRDGKTQQIKVNEIVLDDVLSLKYGDQVPCDSVLLEGSAAVNESLLTGESDNIVKAAGDSLLSGSFLTAGSCRARVEKVGKDSFAARITGEAKTKSQRKSGLKSALNRLLKFVSFAIIPLSVLLFVRLFFDSLEAVLVGKAAGHVFLEPVPRRQCPMRPIARIVVLQDFEERILLDGRAATVVDARIKERRRLDVGMLGLEQPIVFNRLRDA